MPVDCQFLDERLAKTTTVRTPEDVWAHISENREGSAELMALFNDVLSKYFPPNLTIGYRHHTVGEFPANSTTEETETGQEITFNTYEGATIIKLFPVSEHSQIYHEGSALQSIDFADIDSYTKTVELTGNPTNSYGEKDQFKRKDDSTISADWLDSVYREVVERIKDVFEPAGYRIIEKQRPLKLIIAS